MYQFVKGRESIPWRKPPQEEYEEEVEPQPVPYDPKEGVFVGLPIPGNMVILFGSLAAVLLLCLSIFMAVRQTGPVVAEKEDIQVAANNTQKDKQEPKIKPEDNDTKKKTQTPTPPTKGKEKKVITPKTKKQKGEGENGGKGKNKMAGDKNGKEPVSSPMVKKNPPSEEIQKVGLFFPPEQPNSLLFQAKEDAEDWTRIGKGNPDVHSGLKLVSPAGYKSQIITTKGIEVTLWGIMPEQFFIRTPLLESLIEIHHHDILALDMTLHRGRVVLKNKDTRPAQVRIRLDNPTNPELKVIWDVTLNGEGTEILVDRWFLFSKVPFYENPKHPDRVGPDALAVLVVRNGEVKFRHEETSYTLKSPPGKAQIFWTSFRGLLKPSHLESLPDFATGEVKIPEKAGQKVKDNFFSTRKKINEALSWFSEEMNKKNTSLDVALTQALKSKDPFRRTAVVRIYGAFDDLPRLIDALDDKDRRDVRVAAIQTLRTWIGADSDHDYQLFEQLKSNFKVSEALDIMTMLHGFSQRDASHKETYEVLIDRLVDAPIAVRELAWMNLFYELRSRFFPPALAKEVAEIPYAPDAPHKVRLEAHQAWQGLISSGKLPPKMSRQK